MMLSGYTDAEPGATITLTIDRVVQHIAERALSKAIAANEAAAGSVVVLEVDTGEVLAMASWPTYDPNEPGSAARAKARNRAITDAYEIGSVMKLFTIGAALEAGEVSTDELIDVEEGRYKRRPQGHPRYPPRLRAHGARNRQTLVECRNRKNRPALGRKAPP